MSHQFLDEWESKFRNMGWKTEIPFYIAEFLEKESMALLSSQEKILLSSKISKKIKTKFVGVLYKTGFFWDGVTESEDHFNENRATGGIIVTTKRLIFYSFTHGWVVILPFAYLTRSHIETRLDSHDIYLDFEYKLGAKVFKRIPHDVPEKETWKYILESETYENTILDPDLKNARKHAREETQLLESFFATVIQNKPIMFNNHDRLIADNLRARKYKYKNVPKVRYR